MHFAGRDLYILFTRIIIEQQIVVVIITSKQQQIDNFKTNKFGRSYIREKPLSDNFRVSILDTIVEGGDSLTGYIPVTYSEMVKRFSVSQQIVAKIWREFCQKNSFAVQSRGGVRNRKLTDNDLELIETLKASKASSSS